MANLDMIERVFSRITEENLDMGTWGKKNPCGTAMCFAGHAVTEAGIPVIWKEVPSEVYVEGEGWKLVNLPHMDRCEDGRTIFEAGRQVLDLNWYQADAIFHSTHIGNDVDQLRSVVDEVITSDYYLDDDDDDTGCSCC